MMDIEPELRARAEAGEAAAASLLRANGVPELRVRAFCQRYRRDAEKWIQDTIAAIARGWTTEQTVLDAIRVTGRRDRLSYQGNGWMDHA